MLQACCEKAPNKQGSKPRAKAHKSQCLYFACSATQTPVCYPEETVYEKNKGRLQNMLNLWPRKWRRPRKCQKETTREGGCSLRELPPLMPVKTKMWVASRTGSDPTAPDAPAGRCRKSPPPFPVMSEPIQVLVTGGWSQCIFTVAQYWKWICPSVKPALSFSAAGYPLPSLP